MSHEESGAQQNERRVALVTGGSRGIGRAICVSLAEAGTDLAISYTQNAEEAENTARLCNEAAVLRGYPTARFVTVGGTVATPEGCETIFKATVDALGAPDILINNAGITRDNLILRMSVEEYDEVLNTNLRAAFILCKLAARPMVKKRFGRIVNISSVVGLMGNAGQANYAASKAGLIGLTKTLAKELGSRHITVNAVAPGFIETSMTAALSNEVKAELIKGLAVPRLGAAEDVANLVAFLASGQASYITGQVIAVDGGMAL